MWMSRRWVGIWRGEGGLVVIRTFHGLKNAEDVGVLKEALE